ncbi:hypothetical protein PAMP_021227 [Pampus punctatissimus]
MDDYSEQKSHSIMSSLHLPPAQRLAPTPSLSRPWGAWPPPLCPLPASPLHPTTRINRSATPYKRSTEVHASQYSVPPTMTSHVVQDRERGSENKMESYYCLFGYQPKGRTSGVEVEEGCLNACDMSGVWSLRLGKRVRGRKQQHFGLSSMDTQHNTPPPPPPPPLHLSHFTPSLSPSPLFQTCFLQLGGCGSGGRLVSWVVESNAASLPSALSPPLHLGKAWRVNSVFADYNASFSLQPKMHALVWT